MEENICSEIEITQQPFQKLTMYEVLTGSSVESVETYIKNLEINTRVPCHEFAKAFVEAKKSQHLYDIGLYGVKSLVDFMKRLDKIGATYSYTVYDASSFFTETDLKILLITSQDFLKKDVYTLFALDERNVEELKDRLNSNEDTNLSWNNILWMRDTPLVKYNIINPTLYAVGYNINSIVSRFSSASWFENVKTQTVLVAGIGGIGSWVSMLLSRMQPTNIIMYDNDIVESVNMAGQMYSKNNIGLPKVTAMADNMYSFSNYGASVEHNEKFTIDTSPCDIMISGFDNMDSRKVFYNVWKMHVLSKPEEERCKCLLIDGRLAAETFQVYCITGDDTVAMETYESTALFSRYEADNTICSYKQTSYMANMIAGAIVNLFTNFCANYAAEAPIRTLPYYVEYEGALMNFKTTVL